MLTRTPSLPKARTDSACCSAKAANSGLSSPRFSQTKLPCASGMFQPSPFSAGGDPVPFVHQALYSFHNLAVSAASEVTAACSATEETAKGVAATRRCWVSSGRDTE